MKTCDNASVGILITDQHGRYLMFDRATFPIGVAPAAGHVFDDHPGYLEAAHAEVAEELGLTVIDLELTKAGGWRDNRCRRAPGPRGVGHQWQVFVATVTGDLNPSQRETRNVRWLTARDLQVLASTSSPSPTTTSTSSRRSRAVPHEPRPRRRARRPAPRRLPHPADHLPERRRRRMPVHRHNHRHLTDLPRRRNTP